MDDPLWRRRYWATANMQERKSGAKTKVTFFSQDVTLNTGTSNGLNHFFSIALELLSLLDIISLCKNNSMWIQKYFGPIEHKLHAHVLQWRTVSKKLQKASDVSFNKIINFWTKVRKSQKQFFLDSNQNNNKGTLLC